MVDVDKNWSFEDAWAAQRKTWAEQLDGELRPDVLDAWFLESSLHEVEQRIKAGDDGAVLEGIAICAVARTRPPLPEWLADAFLERRERVLSLEATSWDEVFGRPHKRGKHLKKAATKRAKEFLIFFRVREILQREPDSTISALLFERVGREFGFSKTVAEEIYYHWWRNFRAGAVERVHIQYEGRSVTFVTGDANHIWCDHFISYDRERFSAVRMGRYLRDINPGN